MISPQIWEDPSFNKLSISARLLFICMFSNADDEGYLRADPGGLKRLIFGLDEIKQDEIIVWRGGLTTHIKNLHFFENNGEEYAHFLKWDKIQKQQKDRIQESLYPKCPTCLASAKQVLTEVKLSKVKLSKVNIYIPSQNSENFFKKEEPYNILLDEFQRVSNISHENLEREFNKFILYWTEPNKSGTKVRWQLQKTFDVKRRLYTWLSNASKFSSNKPKGKTILGL